MNLFELVDLAARSNLLHFELDAKSVTMEGSLLLSVEGTYCTQEFTVVNLILG